MKLYCLDSVYIFYYEGVQLLIFRMTNLYICDIYLEFAPFERETNTIVMKKIPASAVQDMLNYLYMCDESDARLDL